MPNGRECCSARRRSSLLLSAEAASRQGDADAARRIYAALLDRRDTEFLGLRGLIGQALRADDDAAALPLAERARALRPDAPWLAENLLRLAGPCRRLAGGARDAGGGGTAARTAGRASNVIGRGVVLYELSRSIERDGDLRRASGLAARQRRLAPDLAPIACHNARLMLARGRRRAAASVIERAWQTAPHPELARFYLEARSAAEPLAERPRCSGLRRAIPTRSKAILRSARRHSRRSCGAKPAAI